MSSPVEQSEVKEVIKEKVCQSPARSQQTPYKRIFYRYETVFYNNSVYKFDYEILDPESSIIKPDIDRMFKILK